MATYTVCTVDQLDFRTTSFGRAVRFTGILQSGSHPTVTRWVKVSDNVVPPLVAAKFHNRTVNAIVTSTASGVEYVNQVNIL